MAAVGRLFAGPRNIILSCVCASGTGYQSIRSKHYKPEFRWHRRMKVYAPKYKEYGKPTKEDFRLSMKRAGVGPGRHWQEVPPYIGCSREIVDAYVPVPGDGKYSSVFQRVKNIKAEGFFRTNLSSSMKLRKYEPTFDSNVFASTAQDIYIKAHETLTSKDHDKLLEYVTDNCYQLMTMNTERRTMKWKFIESIEPPKTVQVRVLDLVSKGNHFAQVTVRFHSKQMLAIYDRFGRLIYGSDIIAKDVLEYGVFEKHIINVYGTWKLHAKIIPDWIPMAEPERRTYTAKVLEEIGQDEADEIIQKALEWTEGDEQKEKQDKLIESH